MFQIENCSYVGVQDLYENSNQPMHNLEFATMVYFMVLLLLLQICLTVTLISLIIINYYQTCTKSANKNLLFVLPPKKVLAFLFASKLQVYLKQFTKEHGQAVQFKTPVESVNQMANLFMNPVLKNVTPSTNYAIKISLQQK